MRVFLLVPSFMPYDAVGNDVYGMYRIFRDAGFEANILAPTFHKSYAQITRPPVLESDDWNDANAVLIYHHAIGWPLGEAILARTRNKVVIKYHNITPAQFYEPYSRNHYEVCADGERASRRIAGHPRAMFWGDSLYNMNELVSFGAPRERSRAIPPCHLTEELKQIPLDLPVAGTYRDGHTNVLFVGGLRPNKGHIAALRTFAAYYHIFNSQARLIFAGSFDPNLSVYVEHVQRLAGELGVGEHTVFARSVSPQQLRSFYYVADTFLCLSEHEGFCVPLIEAMSFRVPVLAWNRTAIGETAGDGGIVEETSDPVALAAALHRIQEESALRSSLIECGRRRYEQCFRPDIIRQKALGLMTEVLEASNA